MIARTCTTPENLIKKNTKSNTNSNVNVKDKHVAEGDTWDHNEGHT